MKNNHEALLERAAAAIKPKTDHETELAKLVASSMQTGYTLGKLAKTKPQQKSA